MGIFISLLLNILVQRFLTDVIDSVPAFGKPNAHSKSRFTGYDLSLVFDPERGIDYPKIDSVSRADLDSYLAKRTVVAR
jgi:hypothetical protein